MAWQDLVKIALLGTNKAPVSELPLSEAVRDVWAELPHGDAEARFLNAAVLTLLYEQAGTLPQAETLESVSLAPEVGETEAPDSYARLLLEILAMPVPDAPLLKLIWQKMQKNQWVLPFSVIVPTLEAFMQHAALRPVKPDLLPVLGARGNWILDMNAAWASMFQKIDQIDLWNKGTEIQRRHIFSAWRNVNPEQALAELLQIWPVESARARKEWLIALAERPCVVDIPFVESFLRELNAVPVGKATNEEMKRLCVEILLAQPQSPLFQEVQDALGIYVKQKKGLLGFKSGLALEIPDQADYFLNAETMVTRFGLEVKSQRNGVSDPAFWFLELTSMLHPGIWETLISRDWSQVFEVFSKASVGSDFKDFPLLDVLSQRIGRYPLRPAVQAWLEKYPVGPSNWTMLEALNHEELEFYFLTQSAELIEQPSSIRKSIQRDGWVWSERFSVFVFKCLSRSEYGYHNAEFALELAPHFHLSLLEDVTRMMQEEALNWTQQQLQKKMFEPLGRALMLRKKVEAL